MKLSVLAPALFAVLLSIPGLESTPVPGDDVPHLNLFTTDVLGFGQPRKYTAFLVPSKGYYLTWCYV